MKRLAAIFFCLLLLPAFFLPVYAAEEKAMVIDQAGLLTDAEEAELDSQIQALREQYQMDIVILTVDSLGGQSAQDYADDYYDRHGYGYDPEGSGMLYLLAMEEREWYISTCGNTIYALTDYGIQLLGESILPLLGEGNYSEAFAALLSYLPSFLDAYEEEAPVDGYADYSGDYYHGQQDSVVYYETHSSITSLLISLGIGVLAGGITIAIMISSMNTKRKQGSASDYVLSDTFRIHVHQDLFLYSNVSKVRRQQNTSSGGGGSSVHRSSGGRSHGGGGGRF